MNESDPRSNVHYLSSSEDDNSYRSPPPPIHWKMVPTTILSLRVKSSRISDQSYFYSGLRGCEKTVKKIRSQIDSLSASQSL